MTVSYEQALLAAISALAAAVVALWRKTSKDAERCWEDRRDLWRMVMEQNRVSCSKSQCGARETLAIPEWKGRDK
jgi:hypothetical protein